TERLHANETQRRALLADVAHELRPPLSVIRGNVEGMLDGVYPPDDAHLGPGLAGRARRLRGGGGRPGELAGDAAAALRPRGSRAGVSLEVGATAPVPEVDVDQVRIGEALGNLLTNPIPHTPRGGAVRVAGG